MTYFYVGDIPAEDFVVSPSLNNDAIQLHGQDVAEVLLTDPPGTTVTTLTGTVSGQDVDVTFPADVSVFTTAGIYTMVVVIDKTAEAGSDGVIQADPIRIVADDTGDEWATLSLARDQWIDARTIEDAMLYDLLALSKSQILEYAPVLADGVAVPLTYRMAQITQAKNVYNGSLVDAGTGDIGNDTFTIRPFPLDWQVKQMVRPRRGTPVVG